jgi:UPF0716 family protein affecting phage T7 exclusion
VKAIRKLLFMLLLVAPVAVALYCFVVNQAWAGFGATLLSFLTLMAFMLGNAFVEKFGADTVKKAEERGAKKERERILGEASS